MNLGIGAAGERSMCGWDKLESILHGVQVVNLCWWFTLVNCVGVYSMCSVGIYLAAPTSEILQMFPYVPVYYDLNFYGITRRLQLKECGVIQYSVLLLSCIMVSLSTWELVPGTPSFCTLNKSSKWWLFRWFWLVHSHFAIHCGPQSKDAQLSIVIVLMVFDFTAKQQHVEKIDYMYPNSSDSRSPKWRVLKRSEAQWRQSRDLNNYVWAGER